MAKPFSLEIDGLKKLQSRLDKAAQNIKKEIDAEIGFAAEEIRTEQLSLAPADTGALRQGLSVAKVKEMEYDIVSRVNYSPYQEFGTGKFVNVPSELTDFALQFKGRGIKQVNILPHPFFFPPFFGVRKNLVANIKNILSGI